MGDTREKVAKGCYSKRWGKREKNAGAKDTETRRLDFTRWSRETKERGGEAAEGRKG